MKISEIYKLYRAYPEVVTDSRQVRKDSMFFSLRGERFDGNRFAASALERGARYAVVDDPEVAEDDRYIVVNDSLQTLQELSALHRQQLDIPVIAITGSNGKTTTKELLAEILSTQYNVKATAGNLNNHIGVPLTLLSLDQSAEIAIVEMGANHIGEIAMLCELAMPDYGLVTNIGKAHLEGFGSMGGVMKAKGELYRFLGENGGLIFSNGGDRVLQGMLADNDAGKIYYGNTLNDTKTVCYGTVLSSDPYLFLRISIPELANIDVATGLVGDYNLDNILAAVAVGLHFHIRPENIQTALQGWSSGNNRSERIETENNILIMDAYNANPTSMMAALRNFRNQDHPKKVLILGDMLELGDTSADSHQEILDYVVEWNWKGVFLVGPIFSGLHFPGDIKSFAKADELADWLEMNPLSDSLILLKASRGKGLERLRQKL